MHLLQLKFEFGHRIDVICAVFVLLCSDRVRGMIVLLCSGSVCVCSACESGRGLLACDAGLVRSIAPAVRNGVKLMLAALSE